MRVKELLVITQAYLTLCDFSFNNIIVKSGKVVWYFTLNMKQLSAKV